MRVHEPFTAMDLLDMSAGNHSWPLARALQALQRSPRGVAVLLNCTGDAATLLSLCQPRGAPAQRATQSAMDLRTLRHRRADPARSRRRAHALLGSPRRMPSMAGYGLEVTGFVTHSD